jgi:hypothetical protein
VNVFESTLGYPPSPTVSSNNFSFWLLLTAGILPGPRGTVFQLPGRFGIWTRCQIVHGPLL